MRYPSIVLLLLGTFVGKVLLQGCSLDINQVNSDNMVFVRPNTDTFWPVNHDGNLVFRKGQNVQLVCGHKGETMSKLAKCVSGSQFQIINKNVDLSKPPSYCSEPPVTSTTRLRGSFAEIGFEINNRFIKQLEISLDLGKKTTHFVKHTLRPGSCDATCLGESIKFSESSRAFGISDTDMNNMYTPLAVFKEMVRRLGPLGSHYFDESATGTKHLIRGQLAPQADFVYLAEQRATYSLLNCAPQFQTINMLNWKSAEVKVRQYLRTERLDSLVIFTGLSGVAELENVFYNLVTVYLHPSDKFPVPKFYFKVIIEPKTKRGVALVVINNPEPFFLKTYEICSNTIYNHRFLPEDRGNVSAGYMYACDVLDFNSKIGNILPLTSKDVTSLLT